MSEMDDDTKLICICSRTVSKGQKGLSALYLWSQQMVSYQSALQHSAKKDNFIHLEKAQKDLKCFLTLFQKLVTSQNFKGPFTS